MSTTYPADTPSGRARPMLEAVARGLAGVEGRPWAVAAVYAVLCVVVLFPVFSVNVPPLVDYPNHLARAHILSAWETTPALQQNYVPVRSLRPNMAMDIIVPALATFMSIYMAGKVYIAMTLLSLMGGVLTLRKVLAGRVDLWPVLAFLLLYNWAFFWGFLNYLFTAGLALMAFGGWIVLRERSFWVRLPVFCCAAFVLYLGHLFGLLVYGLLVGGYEIWRLRERRPTLRRAISENWVTGVQFAVPATLFVSWVSGNDTGDPTVTNYGSLLVKMAALVSPTKFGMPVLDIAILAFLAVVLLRLRASGSAGIFDAAKIPLLMLAAAAVAMPNYLMGVWGTDFRLPTIILCVLIAATRFGRRTAPTRSALILVATALLVVRSGAVAGYWSDLDGKFEEFRTTIQSVEPGTKLLVVGDPEDFPKARWPSYESHFGHLAALAVIERAVFLPSIFTTFTSVAVRERLQLIDSPVAVPISRAELQEGQKPADERLPLGHRASRYWWVYWSGWASHFDHVLVLRFDNLENPAPKYLKPGFRASYFDLFEVVRDGDGAASFAPQTQPGPLPLAPSGR